MPLPHSAQIWNCWREERTRTIARQDAHRNRVENRGNLLFPVTFKLALTFRNPRNRKQPEEAISGFLEWLSPGQVPVGLIEWKVSRARFHHGSVLEYTGVAHRARQVTDVDLSSFAD